MKPPEPERQHRWLQKFVGEWSSEGECDDSAGQASTFAGTESVRAIGDYWILAEGKGTMPGGGTAISLTTLGYDADRKQFVGTWVGSMMGHLWVYERGSLDADERVLTLECDGPSFIEAERAEGKFARYRDVHEFRSDDHRVLTGSVRNADGTWTTFMTTHFRRQR